MPRLVALWIDRDVGLLRWAPVLALAFLGAWLLWRSRRERLARRGAERRDAEHAAFLAARRLRGQVAVAAFATPALAGPWSPGTQLAAALPCAVPLVAWGLRRAPRGRRGGGGADAAGEQLAGRGRRRLGAAVVGRAVGAAVAAFPREPGWAWVAGVALASAALAGLEWRRRRELLR